MSTFLILHINISLNDIIDIFDIFSITTFDQFVIKIKHTVAIW